MTRKNTPCRTKSHCSIKKQLEIINTCAPLRQGENGEFFFIADKLYHNSRVLSIAFLIFFFAIFDFFDSFESTRRLFQKLLDIGHKKLYNFLINEKEDCYDQKFDIRFRAGNGSL